MKLKKGYIQVYTGSGKGKTTAALGLALRALGAGLKVYMGQFIKDGNYSEVKTLKKLRNIKIEQFGRGCFIKGKPKEKDIICAKKGLETIKKIISKRIYGIIILDEINIALHFKLISTEDVINVLKNKPNNTEIILTGRYAPKKILNRANLITDMKEIKHYYKRGVKARRGIES